MSTLVAKAYNPINGAEEEIWEGFSWPCLFFGFLWYLYKGMWGWGIIALILAIITWGISWIVFPLFANEQYAKSLLKQGYLNEEQWNHKKNVETQINNSVRGNQATSSLSDELSKLAALKEQGVLTDDEFQTQKSRLLS